MPGGTRPFVYLNVAMTADGKLAPATRKFVPFSSEKDQKLLMELRTRADAVMAGARTVDLAEVTLGPGGEKYRRKRRERGLPEYNLRVVVSGSGTIDTAAKIFKHRFSPIIILTTAAAGVRRLKELRKYADAVMVCGERKLDFREGLIRLRREWKVKNLLCEGGGEVNAALFEQDLVDEIFVTVCPVIFGGRDAPTLADGEGVKRVEDAVKLRMKSMERAGDELYLVYQVVRSKKKYEQSIKPR